MSQLFEIFESKPEFIFSGMLYDGTQSAIEIEHFINNELSLDSELGYFYVTNLNPKDHLIYPDLKINSSTLLIFNGTIHSLVLKINHYVGVTTPSEYDPNKHVKRLNIFSKEKIDLMYRKLK